MRNKTKNPKSLYPHQNKLSGIGRLVKTDFSVIPTWNFMPMQSIGVLDPSWNKIIILILCLLIFLPSIHARSFIIENSSDPSQIYFIVNGTTGNVGINTNNPQYQFHVEGGDVLFNSSSANDFFFNSALGNIGIRTLDPVTQLDINGTFYSNYFVEDSNDVFPTAALGTLSERIAMYADTAEYGTVENNTRIYVNGILQVDAATPEVGTFSVSAGDKITSNKPIGLIDANEGLSYPPISIAGTEFVFYTNRNAPHTVYVYAPYSTANVSYYNDTFIGDTLSLDEIVQPGAIVSFSLSTVLGTHRFSSTAPIIMVKRSNVADDMLILPASREIVHTRSQYKNTTKEGTITCYGTGNIYCTSDVPLASTEIADGAGGDAAMAMPVKMLGDTYIITHDIDDFAIASIEPATIRVYNYSDNNAFELYAEYDHTAASRSNPVETEVGTQAGNGNAIFLTAPILVTGTAPFYLRTNDPGDNEYSVLGYRQSLRQFVYKDSDVPTHWYLDENNRSNNLSVMSNLYNVSIGHAGPDTKLHVQGGVCIDTDSVCTDPGEGNLYTEGDIYVNGNIGIGTTGPSAALHINDSSTAGALLITNGSGNIILFVNGSSGNVGIGNATPTEKLTLSDGNFLQKAGSPKHAGSFDDSDDASAELGTPVGIYVSGKYAYVTSLIDDGVEILDISDPSNPTHVGAIDDTVCDAAVGGTGCELDGAAGIYVSGKYAYVASITDDGVEILDISDPSNPTHVGAIDDTVCDAAVGGDGCELNGAYDIIVSGKYAYVIGYNDGGVEILDISNPSNPTHVGAITDDATTELAGPRGIYVSGKYAYIAAQDDNGVEILDISDPSNPTHIGSIGDGDDTTLDGPYGIYVSGKYAYVTSSREDGIEILDISNASNITHVGQFVDSDHPEAELDNAIRIVVSGKYAYVTGQNDDGVEVLDISNASNPIHVGKFNDSDDTNAELDGAYRIFVSGKYAYVTGFSDNGIEIIDISGIDAPAASIGNIAASTIDVSENVDIGNNLYIRGSLNVGPSGILSDGPVSFYNKSLTINSLGNVGIGIGNATAKLHINGSSGTLFRITGTIGAGDNCDITSSGDGVDCSGLDADYAELYSSSEELEAGDVVVIDNENDEYIRKSYQPYDTKVLGIVSTRPAITIEDHSIVVMSLDYVQDPFKPPIALAGRVPVKVTTENGFIQKGDLLTTSSIPGYAMKCNIYEIEDEDWEAAREKIKMNEKCLNSVLGKALGNCYEKNCKIMALTT